MKVSELRKYTDALKKFAVSRETSIGPQTLIGVQKSGDVLKLISGSSTSGMVVTIDEFVSSVDKVAFTIASRPLLQAVTVLPAKTEVKLQVNKDSLVINAEEGGKVTINKNGELSEAGFPVKPKKFSARGKLDGKKWKQVAKLFKQVSAKVEVPAVQIIKGTGYATAVAPGDRPRYVSTRFPAEGPSDYNMSAYRDFWAALAPLEEDGVLQWGNKGVIARAGKYECYSAPYLVAKYDPKTSVPEMPHETEGWPIMVSPDRQEVTVSLAKKDLLAIIRGQAPFDEHNRVTLEVDTDLLKVTSYGAEEGQEIPAETNGHGIRSVSADYLSGLLSSMDAKEVTLGWSGSQPAISLSAEEYGNWTILLAPIIM